MISTFLPLSGWFQQVFEYPETVFTDTMDRWEGKPQKHGANMSPDEFYKHVLFFYVDMFIDMVYFCWDMISQTI